MAIFIKDITYLPMTGNGELYRGSIRLEGQRIIEMGSNLTPKWGDEIIYGQDKCALPGFVNCHTHAAMTFLRGVGEGLPLNRWLEEAVFPKENKMTGEDFYLGSLLAQLEMLKGGTTTYADMYFDVASAVWAMETSGIRSVLAGGLLDNDGRGDCRLREALSVAEKYHGDLEGRVTFMLAPHSVYACSPQYLQKIGDAAKSTELPIHIHVAETEKEQSDSVKNYGRSVLKHLEYLGVLNHKVLAAHMIHLDDDEYKIAANYDITAVHCPQSNMKLASGVFDYAKCKALGIPVALGTDGCASNNDLDMAEEMRTALLLSKIKSGKADTMGAFAALKMATVDGAKALGLEDEIGTLEVGKKADINIISLWRPHFYPRTEKEQLLSHLAYCLKSGDVHTVIVNGKVVVDHGKALYIDEGKLYQQVQQRAKRL